MASRLTTLTPGNFALTNEEHALLEEALKTWCDPAKFTDEKVGHVKEVFKKVFGLSPDTVLVGSTLPDAILLQSVNDVHLFYVFMQSETPGQAWEAMELFTEGCITFVNTIPFRLVLSLLADSVCGMTFDNK